MTGIATAAAPWLVHLVAGRATEATLALATALAYWCLPQILLYGLYAMLGEALNARKIFGPFTWAPVVNNIVSIVGFLALGALFGPVSTKATDWTPEMITLLGGTATLGIALQAVVLLIFWRRTGLALKPDFRWRGVGLGNVGRLAGWTFLMAFASLSAGVLQGYIVSEVAGLGASATVTANAWLIFMLPYSVIVLSIGTPYFTQISAHAAAGRDDDVRADIAQSIRSLLFFIVAATAAVAAAAIPASRVFTESAEDAQAAAMVLLAYLIGLIPLTILFIVQRTFYAYDDTKTPFWFTIFQCVLIVVTALAALGLREAGIIPLTSLAAAIALGQSIASILQNDRRHLAAAQEDRRSEDSFVDHGHRSLHDRRNPGRIRGLGNVPASRRHQRLGHLRRHPRPPRDRDGRPRRRDRLHRDPRHHACPRAHGRPRAGPSLPPGR